jgi:glycogen operon protein
MAHAGALRVDHVMGLSRLFWVPEGAEGREGAYVRYPLNDLLGQVTLESSRTACMVVGEDLGTVPHGFREELSAVDILGYRVMLLEREGRAFAPPTAYPPLTLACVTNHDLPTVVGWWRGTDIIERLELGLIDADVADRAMAERAEERHALADAAAAEEPGKSDVGGQLTEAPLDDVHRYLGDGASCVVMVQADDLAAETVAVNLPGTDTERANWRRKVATPVEELFGGKGEQTLGQVRRSRETHRS